MSKKFCWLFLSLFVWCVYAQGKTEKGSTPSDSGREWRKQYVDFVFSKAKISQDGEPDLQSKFGAAFNFGNTFFLHKPIGGMLRFGFDVTWLDLNYDNYDIEHIANNGVDKYQYHQGEVSMHIGPSVTIEPVKKLAVHAYFHYLPTFAMLYRGESEIFYGNYASLWVAGGNVSFGAVGLGLESRFGTTNYKPIIGISSHEDTFKSSLSGFRAYLTLKF